MAKAANQKMKILYIMDYLLKKSDEDHPVSMQNILDYLSSKNITAERKAIYNDLEGLREFGMDILQKGRGASHGYFVAYRDFQLPELKLLVDSIQSSKFITNKKTMELIKKIEGLCSEWEASKLQRQVYVQNRIKSMNESVYYNVDKISNAISKDKAITFKYFEYNMKKERVLRRSGEVHHVSPYALIWDNENYYLLGFDSDNKELRHYRVDKMLGIEPTDESRLGKEEFKEIDMSSYSKNTFGMYKGDIKTVTMKFAKELSGPVIDRFGTDVALIPNGTECFNVNARVAVSPQFFSWMCGFGNKAEILGPEDVRSEMKEYVKSINKLYKDKDKEEKDKKSKDKKDKD